MIVSMIMKLSRPYCLTCMMTISYFIIYIHMYMLISQFVQRDYICYICFLFFFVLPCIIINIISIIFIYIYITYWRHNCNTYALVYHTYIIFCESVWNVHLLWIAYFPISTHIYANITVYMVFVHLGQQWWSLWCIWWRWHSDTRKGHIRDLRNTFIHWFNTLI